MAFPGMSPLFILRIAAGASLITAATAQAAVVDADLCYSNPTPITSCFSTSCPLPTNTTVFHCPVAGDRSLPELALQGWIIVHLKQRTYSTATEAVMVEQLTIRKGDRLFANGFE